MKVLMRLWFSQRDAVCGKTLLQTYASSIKFTFFERMGVYCAWFCRNHAKVGRLSRALISKLVERKGEGAAAEGYKLHIRPLAMTALSKPKSTTSDAEPSLKITRRGFLGRPLLLTWLEGGNSLHIGLCSSSSGLVSFAEVRSF